MPVLTLDSGSQPLFQPGDGGSVTIINLSATATVYVATTPVVHATDIPVGPLASISFDGSRWWYGSALDTTAQVAVGPGVTGYFLPASLANIGGSKVYVQAGAPAGAPAGAIPLNSVWFDTGDGSLQTWDGTGWVNEQFSAQNLIQAATILGAQIAAQAVTAGNIANGTLTTAQLAAAAGILGTQIAAATVTSANIAANTIVAANIAAGTITAAQIAAGTITAAQIAAGTITATQIAAGTITAALLSAGIVKAGIIDGTTVQAARYIADGTSGEFLVYTSVPATGNLLLSISPVAGSDSHSNAYKDGLGIYDGPAYLQTHVNATVGAPAIEMVTGIGSEQSGAALYNLPIAKGAVNEHENVVLQGPASTVDGSSVSIYLTTTAKDKSSECAGILGLTGGILRLHWDGNGVHVDSTLYGAAGTLTIGDNVSVSSGKTITADSWHPITLDSGWTAAGGFDAPRYRVLPDGNLQLAGAASRTAFTSNTALNNSNPLPAAYQPANTHHFRGYDASTGTARCGVQISPAGVITGLATASTSSGFCEIDGIIPLN